MGSKDKAALADWENKGGRLDPADRAPPKQEHASCPPSLPSGYEAHCIWSFNDSTGRLSYQFNRVYKRSDRVDSAGPMCLLDEDMSYWSMTWTGSSNAEGDRREIRCVSYSTVRNSSRPRLTFDQFSSLVGMRDALPELLRIDDLTLE